jgi:NAD(P)-dependent dehydrogenase (short-subunit alcohol dehydrogenase family)
METGLKDKVVLITGAAMGIGRSTAEAFAAEGARLALVDLAGEALEALARDLREQGADVAVAQADLSTSAGVSAGIREATSPFDDKIDVLVNNVGAGFVRGFDDLDDVTWRETFEVNFFSYVRATREVLPQMRERGGCIVNVASDLAKQPEAVPIDYSVSKAAILGLTKGLARAEAPKIRVNAVAPGPIWTPFWTKPGGFSDTLAEVHGLPPEEAVAHELSLRQMPLNRLGRPEEVATVIVFLASDLASFVTSSVYGVDGGTVRSLY